MATGLIRAGRGRWRGTVLVCGKCSKKVEGGFGADGDIPLAKALRRRFGLKKGARAVVGVVETKCLGLCPKRAVAVLDAQRPDRWLVVRPGTPLDEIVAELPSLESVAVAGA